MSSFGNELRQFATKKNDKGDAPKFCMMSLIVKSLYHRATIPLAQKIKKFFLKLYSNCPIPSSANFIIDILCADNIFYFLNK